MNADSSKKTIVETSFDLLDWKNGSLTGNGLKQAVDMFKAQDASKQTVVIYDRKSGQTFNIVDINMGNMHSGHGLEIDIDTSKAILKESEKEMNNEKPAKITDWKPVLSNGKTVEVNEINPYPEKMVASVERVGEARSGKWQVQIDKQDLLKSPLPRCKDANEVLDLFTEKYWQHFDENEQEEVNDKLNEASDTFDWAADGYGKGNSETYTWKVLRKIFPNLQFSMVSQQGPGGWPEIKVSGKDRDVKRFMEWWNLMPSKDHKFWKKIMNALEKIYGKPLYKESDLNEADDREPLSHALDAVDVKASTANSKAQDEVQMTATDGDTMVGIDAAIDKDIDAAMEEIYK